MRSRLFWHMMSAWTLGSIFGFAFKGDLRDFVIYLSLFWLASIGLGLLIVSNQP